MDRTVEVLGVVVEDVDVVEDGGDPRGERDAADAVGEDGDELHLRGHEPDAAREPVLRDQRPDADRPRDHCVALREITSIRDRTWELGRRRRKLPMSCYYYLGCRGSVSFRLQFDVVPRRLRP